MIGTIEARFRKPKAFCEQIGHRSFAIVPHEISVKIFPERNDMNIILIISSLINQLLYLAII